MSGSVSIVATAREGRLLTENGKLHARAAGLERDLRKAEKAAEEQAAVTSSALAESEAEGQALHSQVRSLEADLAAAQDTAARAEGRLPLDPWAAAAIAVAIVAVTWIIARRRRAAGPEGVGRRARARLTPVRTSASSGCVAALPGPG